MDTIYLMNPVENESVLGISIDIFAVIFIPLFIFFLGYLFNHIRDVRKENKRLRILEEYIYLQLSELDKDLKKDIEGLTKLVNQIKEDKQQNFTCEGSIDVHIDNVLMLDNTDLYKIFIYGRKEEPEVKLKAFDNIVKNIHSVKSIHNELPNQFLNGFMKDTKRFWKDWSDNMERIRKCFEYFVTQSKISGLSRDDDNFLREFDEVLHSLQVGENYDMFYVKKNYMDKFRELCNRHRNDPRVNVLSNAIVGCTCAYQNYESLRKLFLDLFENHYLRVYKDAKETINNETMKFKKMKIAKIKYKK